MKREQLAVCLLATGICCSISGCRSSSPPAAEAAALPVQVVTVQTGLLSDTSNFNASLQSRRAIQLRPQAEGRLAQIWARSGQTVTAGTPLMQIDPAAQAAAVASTFAAIQAAEADVANAQDTLRSLEATRKSNLATLDYNRWQAERYNALAKEGAVSQDSAKSFTKQFLTAQADLDETDARIRAQRSLITQKQKELLRAKADTQQQAVKLEYYRVTAPFPGTVGDIPPRVGDYVTTDTNLLTLTENQPLEVYIRVPVANAANLKIGSTVELLNDDAQVVGSSRVFFISPRTDDNTQTVLVKALYPNSNNQLRAAQQLQVQVIWDRRPGLLVPTSAVTNLAGQNFVFVAEQDQSGLVARQKPVEIGRIEGNNYQILKGLQPGSQIVTSGVQNLSDGALIKPQ